MSPRRGTKVKATTSGLYRLSCRQQAKATCAELSHEGLRWRLWNSVLWTQLHHGSVSEMSNECLSTDAFGRRALAQHFIQCEARPHFWISGQDCSSLHLIMGNLEKHNFWGVEWSVFRAWKNKYNLFFFRSGWPNLMFFFFFFYKPSNCLSVFQECPPSRSPTQW